ncbi:MAG: M16 family metallopeptidase [Phycisphaerales bacterium]
MRTMLCTLTGLIAGAAAPLMAGAQTALPARPEQIEFPPLTFEPPVATAYRSESAGVPVYMIPDREFPLVTITFSFKGGEYLVADEHAGLAQMTGAMMRRGGTTSVPADEFDERVDFLAAGISAVMGDDSSGASLNCLSSNFDEAFGLFMDMVRNPGFQADKVETYRAEALERMKQRNDNPAPIAGREWSGLLFGWDHFESRVPTEATINAIGEAEMRALHGRVFRPGNLIIGVTGDFDPAEMTSRLEAALSGWERGEEMPDPPAPDHEAAPGVYFVQKDIPQGRVLIGHRGVTRDHPDIVALDMMNDILGGSGFTSRITKRVRSDEGLAYSAASRLSSPVWYPGQFQAFFQSKSSTVAFATAIVLEEMERIGEDLVSEQELATVQAAFIETFPRQFESKQAMLGRFIEDEWTGRDPSYYASIRDRVRAVTLEDVRRVAQEHLHPDRAVILVVGDWNEIAPGDLEGRATMAQFGEPTELPLRDPLTMEPMGN